MLGKTVFFTLLLFTGLAQAAHLGEITGTSFGTTPQGYRCAVTISHPGRVLVEVRVREERFLGNFPSAPFTDQLVREASTLVVDDVESRYHGNSRTLLTMNMDPSGWPRKVKLQRDKGAPLNRALRRKLECGSLRRQKG